MNYRFQPNKNRHFRKFIPVLLLYPVFFSTLYSQDNTPTIQDCAGAKPICELTYEEPDPYEYSGEGNFFNEIYNESDYDCYTYESNGIWYIFTAQTDGFLRFTITSHYVADDYDWIAFNMTDAECSDLASEAMYDYVISSNNFGAGNWSGYDFMNKYTGANSDSALFYEDSLGLSDDCNGPGHEYGPHWNEDIKVFEGNTYILYVSNWSGSDYGYNIDFSESTATIFDDSGAELKEVKDLGIYYCGVDEISFFFTENVICSTVDVSSFELRDQYNNLHEISEIESYNSGVNSEYENSYILKTVEPLTAGTYTLYLIDENVLDLCGNASVISNLAFTVKDIEIIRENYTQIVCHGDSNGTITISANGGNEQLYYSIDGGQTYYENDGKFTNLPAGEYTIMVKTSDNCEVEGSTITIEDPGEISYTAEYTDITPCYGDDNGIITIHATGGNEPLVYSIEPVMSYVDNDGEFTGLRAGTYFIVIRDANDCVVEGDTITLEQPDEIIVNIEQSNISCYGNSDGEIHILAEGGTGNFSYTVGSGENSSLSDYTELKSGTYTVKVIDNGGCVVTEEITLTQPDEIKFTEVSITHNKCFGYSTGEISYEIEGGTPDYDVTWSADDNETIYSLTNLAAGTYKGTITDANNCTITDTFIVTEPEVVSIQSVKQDISCNGGSDGFIKLVVSGGTKPYSYYWSTGQESLSLTGIPAGEYSVTIIDANDCEEIMSFEITQTENISASATVQHIKCKGGSDGSIDLTVFCESGDLEYSWSNGASEEDLDSLSAGIYDVMVTDNSTEECAVASVEITEPDKELLIENLSHTNVLCYGDNTGSFSFEITGGIPGYSVFYTNSEGDTISRNTSLYADVYVITIEDSNQCVISDSVEIVQPSDFQIDLQIENVTCNGGFDGSISVAVSGAVSPYTFSWSTTDNEASIDSLSVGEYNLIITDANMCDTGLVISITEPDVVKAELTVSNVDCYGDYTGTIDLDVIGGSGSYIYEWSNGMSDEDIDSIAAGAYWVIVTDEQLHECAYASVTITEPLQPLAIETDSIRMSCWGGATGAVYTQISGGTPDYSVYWSNGETNDSISLVIPGEYIIYVIDNNECTVTDTFTIVEIECPVEFNIPNIFTPNEDGYNDIFKIKPKSGLTVLDFSSFTIEIYNRWGELIYTWHDPLSGWNGKNQNSNDDSSPGVYFYVIKAKSSDGKSHGKKGFLHLVR